MNKVNCDKYASSIICSIFGDEEFEKTRDIRLRLSKKVNEMADSGVKKFLVGQFNTFDIMSLSVCAEQSKEDNFAVNCVCSTEDRFENTKVFVDVFFGAKTCVYKDKTQKDPVFHSIEKMIDLSNFVIIYFNNQPKSKEVKYAYDYALKSNKSIIIL